MRGANALGRPSLTLTGSQRWGALHRMMPRESGGGNGGALERRGFPSPTPTFSYTRVQYVQYACCVCRVRVRRLFSTPPPAIRTASLCLHQSHPTGQRPARLAQAASRAPLFAVSCLRATPPDVPSMRAHTHQIRTRTVTPPACANWWNAHKSLFCARTADNGDSQVRDASLLLPLTSKERLVIPPTIARATKEATNSTHLPNSGHLQAS